MATEAPWEVIRRAADRLADLAERATPGPWRDDAEDGFVTAEWSEGDETTWASVANTTAANGAWITTLSPAVAEPLVAVLRGVGDEMREAGVREVSDRLVMPDYAWASLRLAAVILGSVDRD